MYVTGVHIYQ